MKINRIMIILSPSDSGIIMLEKTVYTKLLNSMYTLVSRVQNKPLSDIDKAEIRHRFFKSDGNLSTRMRAKEAIYHYLKSQNYNDTNQSLEDQYSEYFGIIEHISKRIDYNF